jgi:hypothetical protein
VREWLGALTLVALFAQALIPAGFMPAGGNAGPLKICIGWMPAPHTTLHDSDYHHADALCPFAQALMASVPPDLSSALRGFEYLTTFSRPYTGSMAGTANGPPRSQSPRGPPTLS